MRFKSLLLGVVFAFATHPALADHGIVTQFSWQSEWGNILPSTRIPLSWHNVKKDISDTVQLCGVTGDYYSKILSYKIDFTGDGYTDYIIDESAYFAAGQAPTCDTQICSASGCQMALYAAKTPSQVLTEDSRSKVTKTVPYQKTPTSPIELITTTVDVPCPASAAENVQCRTDCPASPYICPEQFNYASPIAWVGVQSGWAFIPVSKYNAFRLSTDDYAADGKTPRHRAPYNNNPVFQVSTTLDQCAVEELTDVATIQRHSDGIFMRTVVGLTCVKFYQYAGGNMRDLYDPKPDDSDTGDENDSRVGYQDPIGLTRLLSGDGKDYLVKDPETGTFRSSRELYKRSTSVVENSADTKATSWRTLGLKFYTTPTLGTAKLAVQIKNYTAAAEADPHLLPIKNDGDTTSLLCDVYTSNAGQALFVPTKTDAEYETFRKAVSSGSVSNITLEQCTPKYTAWTGNRVCPSMPCNTVKTVAAERKCIRPTGAYGDCSECSGVTDTDIITATFDPSHTSKNSCFFTQTCYNPSCPYNHHSCLAAESKVLMADGSQKAISDVKIGDKVMGYNLAEQTKALHHATVKALLVTEDRSVVAIDGLKITPNHLLALANGKMIEAGQVRVGTKLVGTTGKVVTVKTVQKEPASITVYNLDLDGADGFVANGVRIQAAPVAKE